MDKSDPDHRSEFSPAHGFHRRGAAAPPAFHWASFPLEPRRAVPGAAFLPEKSASGFHRESDPVASSKTIQIKLPPIQSCTEPHRSLMVTAVSDVEAFVQRLIISKRQNGCVAGQRRFRGDGDVCFARAFYAENIYAKPPANIQLSNGFPRP